MTKFLTLESCYIEEINDTVDVDVQIKFIEYMNQVAEDTEREECDAYVSASQIVLNC